MLFSFALNEPIKLKFLLFFSIGFDYKIVYRLVKIYPALNDLDSA